MNSHSPKPLVICLGLAALLAGASAPAHELIGPDGKTRAHEHVYRNNGYGNLPQEGHRAQPQGGRPIVIWGPRSRPAYGTTAHRQRAIPPAGQPVTPRQAPVPSVTSDAADGYGDAPERKR